AGAGLMLGPAALGQQAAAQAGKPADLNVAIIGTGSQGMNLLNNCLKIPGIRFKAVCDIWPYSQTYAGNLLKKYGQPVNVYTDYQDLLAKEKDLDAVIVATPDWMHAEHAVACLKAGKHVYCEKEMSNSLDQAKQMVLAARQSGKLLQIGHQRRSNPLYEHALNPIYKDKVLGDITNFQGQWNRPVSDSLGWPKGRELDAATLTKYGYDTMEAFRNWRWYKKFSGGPISDLGSHQIDIFSWFLKATPTAIQATGGHDFYKNREWYDNVMTLFEYGMPSRTVRGFYEVLNTSSYGGFYEAFLGTEGSLVVSEDSKRSLFMREDQAPRREWEDQSEKIKNLDKDTISLKIGETLTADGKKDPQAQKLLAESKKPPHQLHLENFFNAVRNGTPLSCPPEVGYETAVAVLRINEAVASGQKVQFKPEEFKV
ncbi:MAG: Gfo/Idh/MocA family oxidoreductase, partial [bacterium]|nr:Gfo/Idh/MocA family oxidoreductase [bacterium]